MCASNKSNGHVHKQKLQTTRTNPSQKLSDTAPQEEENQRGGGEGWGGVGVGGERESSDLDLGNKFSKGLYIVTFDSFQS